MTRNIIVTGAASGIGRAVAGLLARDEGANLVLVDRHEEGLSEVAAELSAFGQVLKVIGDLADPAFCADAVGHCVAAFGGVDAIASNAGGMRGAPLADLSVEDFDFLFALNTRPTWAIAKAAYPYLRQSRGAIVATGSLAASHPTPPLGTYAASKAALVMLVRQMAVEWGPDGIRANVVSPGPTFTPLTASYADDARRAARAASIPLRQVGAADDVARAIQFLLSGHAANITGQDLAVDGGLGSSVMVLSGAGTGQAQKG